MKTKSPAYTRLPVTLWRSLTISASVGDYVNRYTIQCADLIEENQRLARHIVNDGKIVTREIEPESFY